MLWAPKNIMITIKPNVLTKEECEYITSIDPSTKKWKWWEVQQGTVSVPVMKFNARPFLGDIIQKFDIDDSCHIEVLRYDTGSFIKSHTDNGGTHQTNEIGYSIKDWYMSGIILLNDSFTGGELVFEKLNLQYHTESVGSLIEFPAGKDSELYRHKVNTITSGVRYSLVFRHVK